MKSILLDVKDLEFMKGFDFWRNGSRQKVVTDTKVNQSGQLKQFMSDVALKPVVVQMQRN